MVADVLPRQPLVSRGPEDMARIALDERDINARYQLALEGDVMTPLGVKREGDRLMAQAAPPVQSQFATVLKNGEPVLRFGYNLGCVDSHIEPISMAAFRPLEKAGLVRVADASQPGRVSAVREFAWLFLFLLFLAALFEFYAHFVHGRRVDA
jgi:hypothetical protein